EQWEEVVAQISATSHPLVVVPTVVVIRAVELSSWEGSLEPAEDGLVADVHAQRHLRLPTISTEVTLADQQPGKKAEVEVLRHCVRPPSPANAAWSRLCRTPYAERRPTQVADGDPPKGVPRTAQRFPLRRGRKCRSCSISSNAWTKKMP